MRKPGLYEKSESLELWKHLRSQQCAIHMISISMYSGRIVASPGVDVDKSPAVGAKNAIDGGVAVGVGS